MKANFKRQRNNFTEVGELTVLRFHKLLITCLFFLISALLQSQTFPPGFSQVQIFGIYYPTSLDFAPDGRIFCTEKAGKVKIIKNGTVLSTPFLTVTVDQLNERGLSSIILDPNFATNHYVYIYYTSTSGTIHNRLSRFTANGDVAVAGSEVIILEFEPLVNSIHNAGGMAFGPDGKLFLAIGNDNVNTNSQDLTNYKGKVIRINTDGSVPSGNPFTGSESAKRIWCYGLRNPWTIAIQPGTSKLFVDDVGEATWEEINDATTGGKNFGWPGAEGMSTNPAYTNPIYTYHHGPTGTDNGCAITGGAFFNPASTNYPPEYAGKYFFVDYCNMWINYLDLSTGVQKHNFASNLFSSENYIKVGTDGNLYYYAIGQNSLYKIIYTNNNAPVITTQPVSASVAQSQPVTFSVTASGSTPLSYQWKKNGTNISGANSSSYHINSVQTTDAGQYSAYVSNAYGNVTSNSATLTVTAPNTQPVAIILTPPSGTYYHFGDSIHFSGNGTDNEDGTLPASAFNWFIQFHHDLHYHPGPFIPPGVKSGVFSSNFGGETSANVYWRLFLVVTDSKGLTDTTFVDVHPVTSTLNLASQPPGLQLLLEGQPHATPYSVLAISGMPRSLGAVSPQILGSTNYAFDHWLHGGAMTQTVTLNDHDTTYTAVFKVAPAPICAAAGFVIQEVWSNITGYAISSIPVSTTPSYTTSLSLFEEPSNVADNYGSRIRAYLCPPLNGNYIFWIASDDNSELWLSSDSTPANKIKIASVTGWTNSREWTKYTTQQSAPIHLNAGQKYYIESLHKEGSQGDNLAVGWQLPNSIFERPIPGSRLSPVGTTTTSSAPLVNITSPANNTSFPSPVNIIINASASSSAGISKVEFYQGTTLLGQATTSPYTFTWMNVTTGNYTLTAKAYGNNSLVSTSAPVNIIVTTCPTPIITPSGPTTFCSGSVTLSTTTGAGYTFQWKKDGVNITGATNSSYVASVSGSYQVKVIQGSCIAWSAPTNVKVQNGLSASITPGGSTTICSGGHVVLYGNTCSGFTYQWIKDGLNISGATGSVYTATLAGSYQLKVTQSGVNAWSSKVTITVITCTAARSYEDQPLTQTSSSSELKNSKDPFQMKVYPNPNNGMFTIVLNMATNQKEKASIKMLNTLGEIVYTNEFIEENGFIKETVELDKSIPTGIYILQITVGDKVENTNVMLAR